MSSLPTTTPTLASALDRLAARRPIRLLGVWAHPDDEAYLSAGLMHRVAAAGGHVACLAATRGEAGTTPDGPTPPGRLARRREVELRASLAEVGAHSLRFLGHADGGCDAVPFEVGVAEVHRAIEATAPDLVVGFGPDGITGHGDHVAVHRWTTEAWRRAGRGELLYAVLSSSFLARYGTLHDRVGLFGDHRPVGHADDELHLTVALDDLELDRKRRALAAHASQTAGLASTVGEATYRVWWGRETFRRPRPAEIESAGRTTAAA
jgi:LmbE family N-acetylglucosaminyl deacetylase